MQGCLCFIRVSSVAKPHISVLPESPFREWAPSFNDDKEKRPVLMRRRCPAPSGDLTVPPLSSLPYPVLAGKYSQYAIRSALSALPD